MFADLVAILRGLLPSRDLPTPVWIVRLVVVTIISVGTASLIFYGLKDTELGSKWGLGRKRVMSAREFQYISRWVYTNMASIEFNHPEVDSAFLLANYDQDGDFVAGNSGNLGIFSAYAPDADGVINLYSLEDVGNLRSGDLVDAVLNQKRCYSDLIRPDSQRAIERALPGFFADHVVMCPLANQRGESYASLIVFWKGDDTNAKLTAQKQGEILSTTSRYALIIQQYLNEQQNLFLR